MSCSNTNDSSKSALSHKVKGGKSKAQRPKSGQQSIGNQGVGFYRPLKSSQPANSAPLDSGHGLSPATNPQTPEPEAFALAQIPAEATPEVFLDAFTRHAQSQIAAGLVAGIEPPRTVAELKTWMDLHRKAAGMDSKNPQGPGAIVAPLRHVTRRGGPVVDAEPGFDIAGYEV